MSILNLPNLPDLAAVKEQVDRIDATVQAIDAKVDEIHQVFAALAPIVAGIPSGPMVNPFGNDTPGATSYGIISA